MRGKWRQEYHKKEWMTSVDISVVYQMEKEAEHLQAHAKSLKDPKIQTIADRFTYLVAVASGKVSQVDLAASLMPNDEASKIPDPRMKA